MMLAILSATALAAPACDTASNASDPNADGYCVTEDEFTELSKLRIRAAELEGDLAAARAEISSFEAWAAKRRDEFHLELRDIAGECTTRLAALEGTCRADIALARKRSPLERHGFAIGLGLGVVGTVTLTAIVLDVYGRAIE